MKAKVAKNYTENLDWLKEQPLDYRLAMVQQYFSLFQMLINQLAEESISDFAGKKVFIKSLMMFNILGMVIIRAVPKSGTVKFPFKCNE